MSNVVVHTHQRLPLCRHAWSVKTVHRDDADILRQVLVKSLSLGRFDACLSSHDRSDLCRWPVLFDARPDERSFDAVDDQVGKA